MASPYLHTVMTQLSVTGTKATLYALLAAVEANCPLNVKRVQITGDDLQTAEVYLGDSSLTTSRYAMKFVNAGDIYQEEDMEALNSISLKTIYLRSNTGTQTVHVMVRTR